MPNLGTLTKLGVLNLYIEHFQSDSCFSSLAAFCFQTGNGRFPLSAKINLLTRHLKWTTHGTMYDIPPPPRCNNARPSKYLGVIIDHKLKWQEQIYTILNPKLPNFLINLLRRNLRSCSCQAKKKAYLALPTWSSLCLSGHPTKRRT